MKTFSNRYMLLYALAISAVIAVILTVVATSLRERQQANVRDEKMTMLLAAIGVEPREGESVADTYARHFVQELAVATDGSIVSDMDVATGQFRTGSLRAFDIKLKEQQALENDGGKGAFPLYVFEKEGRRGYVIPTQGNGLWGAVYANIALADDLNTVVGVTFSHDGETPGLGAEITSDLFRNQFIDKQILDDDGTVVAVAVTKHSDPADRHQVDAISGGTMTSNGVGEMLLVDLSRYQAFITSARKEASNE